MTPSVEVVNGLVHRPRIDPVPLMSEFRAPTQDEMNKAQQSFDNGSCDHTLFFDEDGYMYNVRKCYLCKSVIGFI